MRKLFAPLALLAALAVPAAAFADPILFTVTGTTTYVGQTTPTGTLTGTISIDLVNGVFTSDSLVFTTPNDRFTFSGALAPSSTTQGSDGGNLVLEVQLSGTSRDGFSIPFDFAIEGSMSNMTTGTICSETAPCGSLISMATVPGGAHSQVLGGSIGVTPEPSSLALLGTGLLGVAGAVRRRLRRANA